MEDNKYRNAVDGLGLSRHDGSTPNQHTSIMTSSFQTEKKNSKEKEDLQRLNNESKSPAKILDFSKFESKENTRQMDTKMFAVSNTEEIAAQMQRTALAEQNPNVKHEELKRTGFSVFTNTNIGTKYYRSRGRVGSKSPRRSPLGGAVSAKLEESKKQMKFSSPKADENKQVAEVLRKDGKNAENGHQGTDEGLQAHTKSVIEYSKTDLNSDFKQQNNVNMQIDRLQLLHGVLDSGVNEGSCIHDRPTTLADSKSELKHAESPKKVPPFTLKAEVKSYDRHQDSIKKSDSRDNINFGESLPDKKSDLKNEQNLMNQSASQNISARYSQINVANNHVNHLSSSTIQNNFNMMGGSTVDLAASSKQREAVGRTPKVDGKREGDMEQCDKHSPHTAARSTYTKVEEYLNRDKYNETSASQLQLNSKNMSTMAKANPREQTPNYLQGRSSLINTYSTHGGLTGLAQNHLKSTIVEIQDNISNNGGTFANQLEKCDVERESSLTPNANKPSYHVPNYPSNVSQLSGQYRQQSSISPTRSVIGLTSLAGNQNKDKIEQALQERVNKGLEEIHRVKKESRAKEQEYEKKIALQEQQIELLTLQVKETEQREQQQRSMYDKMFVALEQGNFHNQQSCKNCGADFTQSASRGKKPEEMFNSTQMSFGKEIEQMQKQFQDEMQARINELENMLNAKEQELVYEAQKNEQKLTSLTKNFQTVTKENQDLKLQHINLQRLLDGKTEELAQCQNELRIAQTEMHQLQLKQQGEITMIEKDTQAKYDELKSVYQAAQTSKSGKDAAQQKKTNIQMDLGYLERIHELEKQMNAKAKEHQEAANTALKEIAQKDANINQITQQLKTSEQKMKSKKEKIKGLQLEYGDKNRECERHKIKNEQLEEQLKQMVQEQQKEIKKITEKYEMLQRNQEEEWKKREESIKKEKELKHGMIWEGNGEAQLSKDEKDQEQKVLARSTAVELNFDKINDEAEAVKNSQLVDLQRPQELYNDQLTPVETYGCKDSHDDEESPATQRNEVNRNNGFVTNEQAAYCDDQNCSLSPRCSRCLRNQTEQRQYANQNIQPRSKSQNSRPPQQSTSSQTQIQTKAGSQQSRSHQSNCGTDMNVDQAHHSASASQQRSQQQSLGQIKGNQRHSHQDIENREAFFLRNSQNFDGHQHPQQPEHPKLDVRNSHNYQNLVEISYQDLQLFNRLKKMIDATAQMECIGCQKLIPTIQFYEHLLESNDGDTEEEQLVMQSHMQLQGEELQKMTQNHQQFNQFYDESISDANCLAMSNSNLHNESHGAFYNPHQDSQQRVGAFQANTRPSRSKSAGRPTANQQQHLLTQPQLAMTGQPFLAEDTFKPKFLEQSQKYQNALIIIKKQQMQIAEQRAQLQEFQEVIQKQEQALLVYSRQLQQNGADGSWQLLQSANSNQLPNDEIEELQQLKDDKQRMQLSMDRLKLQLEQKKTQLALLEEKKAENELELKKEKKFLLESFLKARDENKQLIELQQQQFMEAQCSNDQFTQNQQNYNDDQIINENDFDLQNYENNGEEHPLYDHNDESQQLINLQQFELQSQHSTQNQTNMNLNKTDYILASGFSTQMNSQVANMKALNANRYQTCAEQNYQTAQQNQQQSVGAAKLASQKKYRLKIIDSSHTNTRGTNSQYQSASNISRASIQLPGSQQRYARLKEGAEHHSGGGDLDDDVNDLSSKRRQDEETLSQIEELEKKLDQQMSGMYEPQRHTAHDDYDEVSEPTNYPVSGDGHISSKRSSLRQPQPKSASHFPQQQQQAATSNKGYIVNPQPMFYNSRQSQWQEVGHNGHYILNE